jgi:hypothetical protein
MAVGSMTLGLNDETEKTAGTHFEEASVFRLEREGKYGVGVGDL